MSGVERLPHDLPADHREHICHVLRLFVVLRVSSLGLDLASAPAPVRAVAAGRGMRLAVRDLWLVGTWVGLTPDELTRAAQRACGMASGREAA